MKECIHLDSTKNPVVGKDYHSTAEQDRGYMERLPFSEVTPLAGSCQTGISWPENELAASSLESRRNGREALQFLAPDQFSLQTQK